MAAAGIYGVSEEVSGIRGQSRSSYYLYLKDVYAPSWELHYFTKVMIASVVSQLRGKMGGRKKVSHFRDRLPASVGYSLGEGSRMPTPEVGRAANPEMLPKYEYGRLAWTGVVQAAARMGKQAAWNTPRNIDMMDAEKNWELKRARKIYGGNMDILGVVKTWTNATKLLTLAPRNDRDSDAADFFKCGVQNLRLNDKIGMVDAADGINGDPAWSMANNLAANEVSISARNATSDTDNPTVTLDVSPEDSLSFTPAVGDYVIAYGSRKDTVPTDATIDSGLHSQNGLPNLLLSSIAAYSYGLSKTTYPSLQGVHEHFSGTKRSFSEMLVTMAADRVHDEGSGNVPTKYILHRSTRREVVQEHEGDRRFAPVQTTSGHGQLQHTADDKTTPYETDAQCLPGMVWGLNPKHWGYYENMPYGPLPERFVVDKDENEIIFRSAGNIECTSPFDQFLLDDLIYDVYALTA